MPPPVVKNLDLLAIDKTADPCADFYRYACGNWIKENPVPGDEVRWLRSFSLLEERNRYQLWQELDKAARKPVNPQQKQYGDFFAACMNVAALEKKGLEPLEPAFKRISAIGDTREIAALIGDLAAAGEPAPLFRLDAERDLKDSSQQILTISPGGLTLPNPNSYVGSHSRFTRKRYTMHLIRMFTLAGDTLEEAEKESDAVLQIETGLANASIADADSSDPKNRYHIYAIADLQRLAPDFNFTLFFHRIGAKQFATLDVSNPEYIKAVNALLALLPVESWKSYLRWHILNEQVSALPRAFRDEDFAFYGSNLARQDQPEPRWMQCTEMTTQALGDAIDQEWVKENFSPTQKDAAEKMTVALEKALGNEIKTLPWMSDQTKEAAEAKLALIRNRIGYPEKWRDYSGLKIDPGDLIGNLHRCALFERNELLSETSRPPDKRNWELSPSTVDVRYLLAVNGLEIPAGIVQSPFFDLTADPALNFGGIGAVIGHELTHGFDKMGSNYDGHGNLHNWQTADDLKNFNEAATCEEAEYKNFGAMPEPDDLPRLKVNGKLTLAENTADNGGLRIAFMALMDSLAADGMTPEDRIDGYTEKQRFFLSFAQLWCQSQTSRSARLSAATDPHSPARWRVNGTVQNFDEFGKAFGCTKGQPMYPADACRVW